MTRRVSVVAMFGLIACGSASPSRSGEATGKASVALSTVPSDALCVSFTVTPTTGKASTTNFDTPDAGVSSASYALGLLPLGADTFSGKAYDVACSVTPKPTPTWIATPVTATVATGTFTNVTLDFRRDNPATAGADFVENFVDLAPGSNAWVLATSQGSYPGVIARVIGPGLVAPIAPPAAGALTDVVSVSEGNQFACALRSGGTVSCWGYDFDGALGPSGTLNTTTTTPKDVGLTGITRLSVAQNGTVCAMGGGSLWCWGNNGSGQVNGSPGSPAYSATPVKFTVFSEIQGVSTGGDTTCAIVDGGLVSCFGGNGYGELGIGNTNPQGGFSFVLTSLSPSTDLEAVVDVEVGSEMACALRADRTVWCWGDNQDGEIGNGSTTNATLAVQIGLPGPAAQVATSFLSTCARLTSGAVYCWGAGSSGENGVGTGVDALTPAALTSLGAGSTTRLMVSGGDSICALEQDLSVLCWGWDAVTGDYDFAPTPLTL